MAANNKPNKSILEFFKPKPAQPVSKPSNAAPARPTFQSSSASRTSPAPHVHTLSLSPAPSTDLSEPPFSPRKEDMPSKSQSSAEKSSDRVIENSDDNDDDSSSEIEDLRVLLAARSSERARQASNDKTPSTPAASRQQKSFNFHSSPLAVLPKYKIDMKSLVSFAQDDEAAEESSKKVKEMLAARREDGDDVPIFHDEKMAKSKLDHDALLDSVVADNEDGGAHKVKRALMRTEATATETRWYFFDTHSVPLKTTQDSFPVSKVPKSWKAELGEPRMRQHTFLSGFAEDMVGFGKKLPDELFLWMLDEICYESSDPLRSAYINILRASSEQVGRLVDPLMIQTLFVNLGAASGATIVTEKIRLVNKLPAPYAHRNWANLLSVIKLLGRLAKYLTSAAKMCTICMLLRMSMDKLVAENIDILDAVQETTNRLCLSITHETEWTTCCAQICTILFGAVEESTLRLQMVEVISSIHPRTHDLRRRLAMCFYFNDATYAKSHSHTLMDMESFINRLHSPDFDTSPQTDYRELTALILLLDIALDDGRSTKLDLTDAAVEKKFNEDVDALRVGIKEIFNSIGHPGTAFISRIEAKEALELVSQRITDTVRTKRKPRHTWFDQDVGKKDEDLQSEKKGMADFVSRMKGIGNGTNGSKAK
ncbi:uncharacterized protein LY89DRAFT_635843 [Mollisia scopiformis]|uniref:Uncharacterized protein n=1 Tax=Mollisia scopiformis TaxID=149040 RepID=A0A194XU23_MOLSC|nr:uncharacterized protein LY89DRAFT_635843 [Mollisia scopiformis]KUJ23534.1 hypothetical protein LY89DRAFT_635843 [Mollisia scopiformis]